MGGWNGLCMKTEVLSCVFFKSGKLIGRCILYPPLYLSLYLRISQDDHALYVLNSGALVRTSLFPKSSHLSLP